MGRDALTAQLRGERQTLRLVSSEHPERAGSAGQTELRALLLLSYVRQAVGRGDRSRAKEPV